jgi:broad specificity phosphatase PhoE
MLLGRSIDAPLDANGVAQARALASHFAARGHRFGIECSPRLRTLQTAQAISRQSGCSVTVEPAFDEVDFGAWGGQSFEALNMDDRWRTWNSQRSTSATPAGETVAGIQERVTRRLTHLAAVSPAATIGIVTHAEIIRSLLLSWLRVPVDAFHRVEVHPASVTTVDYTTRAVRVLQREEPAAV